MSLSVTSRATRLAVLATVGLVALSACGDKAEDNAAPASGGGSSTSAGATNKATGAPILVGYIDDGTGAAAVAKQITGAKAAVSYVNGNGGVNGRPIELVECSSASSPESSATCANEMISKKVVAVVLGQNVGADATAKPLHEANIPIYATNGQGNALLDDPQATFASMGKALTFAGVWKFFKEVNTLKPVLISPDLGAESKALAEKAIIPSAKAAGLDLSVTFYNPASPDWAAAITAAKKKGADGLYILGGEAECTNGVKTAKQLGWTGVLFGGTCTQYAKTLGAQAEGVYTLNFQIPSTALATAPASKKAQVQTYIDAMKAAGAADETAGPAAYSFSSIATLADMLRKVTGDITAATATPAITTYAGDVFLAGPVDCSKRPMPGGSCGTTFVGLKTEKDGTQSVVTGDFIDATKA